MKFEALARGYQQKHDHGVEMVEGVPNTPTPARFRVPTFVNLAERDRAAHIARRLARTMPRFWKSNTFSHRAGMLSSHTRAKSIYQKSRMATGGSTSALRSGHLPQLPRVDARHPSARRDARMMDNEPCLSFVKLRDAGFLVMEVEAM